MIFTYWTSPEASDPPSAESWRSQFPGFKVFGDPDVLPLLESEAHRALYSLISIPACKSDIARLVLLREHGGLYVDSHCGPSNQGKLLETVLLLARFDLILFDRISREDAGYLPLVNSAMAARRGTPVLSGLIASAFSNLSRQWELEQATQAYVPYNIFALTGAWDISVQLFDTLAQPIQLRHAYKQNVFVYEMQRGADPGFTLYEFYEYRKPGTHWSERQQVERLFKTTGSLSNTE